VSEDKITLKIDSVDKLTEHWIAEGERIATESIIKLLEDDDQVSHIYIDRLIALIKGEK
jgi:hypothetical protein